MLNTKLVPLRAQQLPHAARVRNIAGPMAAENRKDGGIDKPFLDLAAELQKILHRAVPTNPAIMHLSNREAFLQPGQIGLVILQAGAIRE
ncbi:hypothetical protein [Phaeobacter sp. J2-8]|uniref:hypothetical protein n=1 Tax=Phaeobacter sp. J2-8 TaxID=2931394 RepID=UPI001FD35DB5|nr:hypothetical protein [Phaeobacter sp. J2-8]MCJ7874844.1 hypothetical protein [Phaeobacter sp. J2-8]